MTKVGLAYETPHRWHREVESACRPESENHPQNPTHQPGIHQVGFYRREEQAILGQSSGLISADDCIRTRRLKCQSRSILVWDEESSDQVEFKSSPSSFYLYQSDIEYAKHAKIGPKRAYSQRVFALLLRHRVAAMTSSSPAVRVANVGPHVRVRKASRQLTLKPIPANQPSPNPTSLEHAREHVRLGQSAAVIRKVPFEKLCFP
jgi:hypothetical protein